MVPVVGAVVPDECVVAVDVGVAVEVVEVVDVGAVVDDAVVVGDVEATVPVAGAAWADCAVVVAVGEVCVP